MPDPKNSDRLVRLSQVEYFPKTFLQPCVVTASGTTSGRASLRGSTLIRDISEAHGESRSPAALMLANSEKVPGDMVGIPTMDRTDDSLDIDWKDKGKLAVIDLAKLLKFKKIEIPDGTNLVIDLYEDVDSEFGQVVGLKLTSCQFFPRRKGTPRKKKSDTPNGANTGGQPAPASGEQTP
jgi:hypothetical protein